MESNERVLRILDAAVLDGDSIADLSFKSRIQAIKKFCAAVNKPGRNNKIRGQETFMKHSQIVCAETFSFQHLLERMKTLKLAKYKGETVALFPCEGDFQQNGESKEEFFACRAVRFVQILKGKILAFVLNQVIFFSWFY